MPELPEARRWTLWICPVCGDSYVAGANERVEGVRCFHGGAPEKERPLMESVTVIPEAQHREEMYVALSALRTIRGPAGDDDAYIGEYRQAGGGYEGLQAVAREALERLADPQPRAHPSLAGRGPAGNRAAGAV